MAVIKISSRVELVPKHCCFKFYFVDSGHGYSFRNTSFVRVATVLRTMYNKLLKPTDQTKDWTHPNICDLQNDPDEPDFWNVSRECI